jgi:hypothetical protein
MDKETKQAFHYFILEVIFIFLTYAVVQFYKEQGSFAYGMFGFPIALAAIIVFVLNFALLLKVISGYRSDRIKALSFSLATAAFALSIIAVYYIQSS